MVKNNSQSSDEDEPSYDADLIAFDKIGNMFCKGHCNVKRIIKKKSIRVKPYQKEFAPALAPMKMMGYTYYMKNNIIFVFAGSRENDDFALVFCSVEHCKDVYERYFPEPPKPEDPTLKKKKKKPIMKNVTDKLNHRFLIPICRAVVANSKLPETRKDPKLTMIFKDWLENFSEKTKGPFIDFAKENDAYCVLYPDENRTIVTKEVSVSPKKKKHSDGKDGSDVKAAAVAEKSKKTKSPKNDEKKASVSRKNKQSDNENKQRSQKQDHSVTEDNTESGTSDHKSEHDKTPKSVKQRPQKQNHSGSDATESGTFDIKSQEIKNLKIVEQRPQKQNHSVTEDIENSNNNSKHDETPKRVKQRPRKQKRGDAESDSENKVSPVPAKKVKTSAADEIILTFARVKDGTNLVDKMLAIADDEEDGDVCSF